MTNQEHIHDEKRGCCCNDKKHQPQIRTEMAKVSCCGSNDAEKKVLVEPEGKNSCCGGGNK